MIRSYFVSVPVVTFLFFFFGLHLYTGFTVYSYYQFKLARSNVRWRVHVNGIRGKSTVTRYLVAIFRAAGLHTFGKTTGSAARVLQPNGKDFDFGRKGFANVNEQVLLLRNFFRQKADAVVLECMAVNPVYAEWLENMVMKSQIGVITNVRYDHADYMGETLEEIALSLSRTIPSNGIIITAEQQPALVSILHQEAKKKSSHLLIADSSTVFADELASFNHFAIEANVAIGFVVADLLGLSRDMALRAMQAAEPDPGAFLLQHIKQRSQTIVWANLFAVNDRESFVDLCERLFLQHPNHERVVILNNRHDRPTRVRLFAELAIELGFELAVTFGDYETEVNEVLSPQQIKLLNLGNTTQQCNANGEQLLSEILMATGGQQPVLLIGTVNIHTVQAERLLEYIHLLQISTSVVD